MFEFRQSGCCIRAAQQQSIARGCDPDRVSKGARRPRIAGFRGEHEPLALRGGELEAGADLIGKPLKP
jgi:hypothetical protein